MLTVLIMNDTQTFLASFELMDAVHEYLTSWILLQFTSPKAFFFFLEKKCFFLASALCRLNKFSDYTELIRDPNEKKVFRLYSFNFVVPALEISSMG